MTKMFSEEATSSDPETRIVCTSEFKKMLRRTCIALFFVYHIQAFMPPGACCAGLIEKPRSWKAVSPNSRFVFVSIASVSLNEELAAIRSEKLRHNTNTTITLDDLIANARQIRSMYSVSGMYRNDGSTTPLWTIKRWVSVAYVACDGKHIVVPGSWTREPQGDYVAQFIANGKTVRDATILDIFCQFVVHRIVDGRVPECINTSFDPVALRYTVVTDFGDTTVFDARTGSVIFDSLLKNTIERMIPSKWMSRVWQSALAFVENGLQKMTLHSSEASEPGRPPVGDER